MPTEEPLESIENPEAKDYWWVTMIVEGLIGLPVIIMIWQDDSPDKWQELLSVAGGMVVVGIPLLCVFAWLNRKPYGLHAICLILIIGLALLGLTIHFGYF